MIFPHFGKFCRGKRKKQLTGSESERRPAAYSVPETRLRAEAPAACFSLINGRD
jgi:hypothetical protein